MGTDLSPPSAFDPRTFGTAPNGFRCAKGTSVLNEYVEPLGMRVLIRKDEGRHETKGGIVLPDDAEIPTITGRIVEISLQVSNDIDFPIRKYDKVLFHPAQSIPVDFESDNKLFVVPVEDIVAVFRRHAPPSGTGKAGADIDEELPNLDDLGSGDSDSDLDHPFDSDPERND